VDVPLLRRRKLYEVFSQEEGVECGQSNQGVSHFSLDREWAFFCSLNEMLPLLA
jgi:hypothetical protein